MDKIMETLNSVIVDIVIALIGLASVFVLTYLKRLKVKASIETQKISSDITQEYIQSILERVYHMIEISVDQMEVTLVKSIKAESETGKLSIESGKKVAQEAYKLFMNLANDEIIGSLGQIVGDTETYLYSLIDSVVLSKKNDLLKSGVTDQSSSENGLIVD